MFVIVLLWVGFPLAAIATHCSGSKPYVYGDSCVSSCPKGYEYHLEDKQQRCFATPATVSSNASFPIGCKFEALLMFFNWVSYDTKPGKTGMVFSSANGYKRLSPACGSWRIANVLQNNDNDRKAFVLIVENRQSGQVLVVWRGTESNYLDWLSNFEACLVACPLTSGCGRVHDGFLETYFNLRLTIAYQLVLYYEAGYDIVITGHSQGASTAQLTAFDLLSNWDVGGSRFKTVTFGTPRTGDDTFAAAYNLNVTYSYRWIARTLDEKTVDAVTTVPPAFAGYEHTKNARFVLCRESRFGNFQTIPGIEVYYYPSWMPSDLIPNNLGCHFQEVYEDGLLYG